MARTRLTQTARNDLKDLARKLITIPVEAAALDAAYQVAFAGVIAAVAHRYAPKDMKVLARYEVTTKDGCLNVQAEGRVLMRFLVDDHAQAPMVPIRRGCGGRVYLVSDEVYGAVEAWENAKKSAEEARKQKQADYNGLITASRFFEDVVEVWPEAEQLRTRICGQRTALSIVSPDLVSRIRADVAARAA